MIQDIGFYPLSSRVFGDLAHYARTGDFVVALLDEARTPDEYAFALGALSHYVADSEGHPAAVNPGEPLVYPKLRAKYGDRITYEDNPAAHLETEFGFDVVEVAAGGYRPDAYRDFIGFKVSKPVLARAFERTYGLRFDDVFVNLDLSVGTFRRAVSTVIPAMTKVAWEMKRDEISKGDPEATHDRFVFALSREEYEQQWGTSYDRPGTVHKVLAVLMKAVPRIGPFKALAFKPPPPEAERLFRRSLTVTIERYETLLSSLPRRRLSLANLNLDLGRPVEAGTYRLADETYARWLRKLADHDFEGVTPAIREHLLAFYAGGNALTSEGTDRASRRILRELDGLRAAGTAP